MGKDTCQKGNLPPTFCPENTCAPSFSVIITLAIFLTLAMATVYFLLQQEQQSKVEGAAAIVASLAQDITQTSMVPEELPLLQPTLDRLHRASGSVTEIHILAPNKRGKLIYVASTDQKELGEQAEKNERNVYQTGERASWSDADGNIRHSSIALPIYGTGAEPIAALVFSSISPDVSSTVLLYIGVTVFLFFFVVSLYNVQQRRIRRERGLRKSGEKALREKTQELYKIMDLAPVCIFAKDKDSRFLLANETLADLYGLTHRDVVGRLQSELEGPTDEQLARLVDTDRDVIRSGQQEVSMEQNFRRSDGRVIRLETTKIPFTFDGKKAVLGVSVDITKRKKLEAELKEHSGQLEQKVEARMIQLRESNEKLRKEILERQTMQTRVERSLKEKESLLQEIHHRVMNNLQVISGLLDMSQRQAELPETKNVLRDVGAKIQSISLVHTQLYKSERFDSIDLSSYVEELGRSLVSLYAMPHVTILYDLQDLLFPLETASPCALALNELLANALKHAFSDRSSGEIRVELKAEGTEGEIRVEDNGNGLPEGFSLGKHASVGLKLLDNIVTYQLRGKLLIQNREEGGTRALIVFPLPDVMQGNGEDQEREMKIM